MKLRLTAPLARYGIREYTNRMNEVIKEAKKNFDDMDFENADRRKEMEEIIQEMIRECGDAIEDIESLQFEE